MNPDTVKLLVDVVVVLIGFYAVYQARRSAIGGLFGQAMNLILWGIVVLTVNHILDTLFLAKFLKGLGHTTDLWQGPHVHRYINLLGFVLVAAGFSTIAKSQKK